MKNITTIDFKQWATNSKLTNEKKLDWTPDVDEEFLNHVLPILASIPLLRNADNKLDTGLILDALNTEEPIHTPNGLITGNNLRQLISFLYREPRRCLVKGSQTKNPILASLTPLVLYANKLYKDIAYEEWDKKSKYMAGFLGYTLQPILKITKDVDLTNIVDLREAALTFKTGAKKGTMAPLTSYKMNIKSLDPSGKPEYPKIALFMYLQIWLANVEVRHPNSMILDPLNWDRVPEAFDAAPICPEIQEKSNYMDF